MGIMDVIAILSFSIAISGVGIALLIYHKQSKQSNKIETLTGEIHGYVEKQKNKETLVQADYARRLLTLINLASMKIHSINVQIKFLKESPHPKFSKERLEEELWRRESVRNSHHSLQELMSNFPISQEVILEVFEDEKIQLCYDKMWKMFVFNDSLMAMGEDYFESFMDFINTGVDASKELHKLLIQYVPENERKNFVLRSVEPKN